MNKSGQLIMIRLLMFFMLIATVVALIPAMRDVLDIAQGSDALNCQGFIDRDATANKNLTYNASLESESLACLAIDLYIPYLLLVVLIGGITYILFRPSGGAPSDEFGF